MAAEDDCVKEEEASLEGELTDVNAMISALEKDFDLSEVRNILIYERLVSQRKTLVRKIKEKKDSLDAERSCRRYTYYV